MSLYEDLEIGSATTRAKEEDSLMDKVESSVSMPSVFNLKSDTPPPLTSSSTVNKLNLTFLKSQLEAKKAILQNAASQKSAAAQHPPPPALIAHPPLLEKQKQNNLFKLKPHKALPLPFDSTGAFSLIPKSLKEDKVFLFGEIMIEDEYNPTNPTDYMSFKQKREQQRLKEKIAKEIAERLAKETAEEEEKRKKGAAIAPPSAFVEEVTKTNEPTADEHKFEQPKLPQFGKGVSRGLGVAANIMTKMGYRHGSGLGAKEQGISRPLEVQRTGKNIGLIVGEEGASAIVTSLEELNQEQ